MLEFICGNEKDILNNPQNNIKTAFVIVEYENKFMLLYNKYHKHWELTGGFIEQGESPKECAIRECKEESNQKIENLTFIGLAKYEKMDAVIYYSHLSEKLTFFENNEIEKIMWWKQGDIINGNVEKDSIELIEKYKSAMDFPRKPATS
jgi:8-oxo-dGTP diphosphatase